MGLIGGVARTAVIAGTATAVSNNVSRRQGRRWQEREYEQQAAEPQYAPQYTQPPPAPAEDTLTAELERLGELKSKGLISDEEFSAAKKKLLGL
jgi:hypothetical protein